VQPVCEWASALSSEIFNQGLAAARSSSVNLNSILSGQGPFLHSDAVQALGKMDLSPLLTSGLDSLALSGHKIGGPQGIGALWVRSGTPRNAFLRGGPQEMGWRAGTENVLGVVGFAAAIRVWQSHLTAHREHLLRLRDEFESLLTASIPDLKIFGKERERLPQTSLIHFPDGPSDLMLMALDMRGFFVSSGSACASGTAKFSTAVLALGFDKKTAGSTLRFSFGVQNQGDQVKRLAKNVENVFKLIQNRHN
jgi:cysteine desulfurase